ncbi:MAG TPA: glycosyltransferase family 4 protein, partial [Chitinophagaceae bacterium]
GEFERLTWFQRNTIAKLLKHAVHLTTVSDYLAKKIRDRFQTTEYTVIPNLVQMDVFRPVERPQGNIFNFVHVSTLSPQKNAGDLIEACGLLKQRSVRFLLHVVGPEHPEYRNMIREKGLDTTILFHPEMPQLQLAELVAASDALILYSNYETFGCVIVEANACGLPVIVSDFPVFYENVEEGVTGIHVPLHQPAALAEVMTRLMRVGGFNRETIISITRRRYSAEVVGEQFGSVYRRFAKH